MNYDRPLPTAARVGIKVASVACRSSTASAWLPQGKVTGLIGPNGAARPPSSTSSAASSSRTRARCGTRAGAQAHPGPPTHQDGDLADVAGRGALPAPDRLENVMIGGSSRVRSGLVADSLGHAVDRRRDRAAAGEVARGMAEMGIQEEAARLPGEMPYPVQKKVAMARPWCPTPRCCCSTSRPAASAWRHGRTRTADPRLGSRSDGPPGGAPHGAGDGRV